MIEIKNLTKTFTSASGEVNALNNVSLTIGDGDIYGIIGMSGAGKSTLVRCINMLERPTSGTVVIDGKDMALLKPDELRRERREITMIFQQFNLLMQRNCLSNICFPMLLAGVKRADAVKKARELLALVGLSEKEKAYPSQLSGGQQQRIAIARALATNPKVLLCDEATSALDPNTTHSILSLIKEINQKLNITVVVITHQMSVVEEICDHVAILDGGEVVEEGRVGDVFASPKSNAAKRLVFPGAADELAVPSSEGKKIRLLFNGAKATGTPLIAGMAVETGVMASIISASTRNSGGAVYGSMLLGIENNEESLKKALSYIGKADGVTAEEVDY